MSLAERRTQNPFETLDMNQRETLLGWLGNARLEVLPTQGALEQISRLPLDRIITVTSSPSKSADHTVDFAISVAEQERVVVPHFAARHVRDSAHARNLTTRLKRVGINHIFLVGGDNPVPSGEFPSSYSLLNDLAMQGINFGKIGIAGYPEGNPHVSNDELNEALALKQELARQMGAEMYIVTQMCFDSKAVKSWLQMLRRSGINLPVLIGIPGPVNRFDLVRFALACGVGDSLRFIGSKGRLAKKLMKGDRPDDLLTDLIGEDLTGLGVGGLHIFTFNKIDKTISWSEEVQSYFTPRVDFP